MGNIKKITTIILDDEEPAVDLLTNFSKKLPNLEVVKATTDAFEVINLLENQSIDLLFLDIEMPDITGLELLRNLENSPLVVFTTAYERYALNGYDLNIVDYLLKPIRFTRFSTAVKKVEALLNNSSSSVVDSPEYIVIKSDYKNVKIDLEEILYVEGLKDYVKIVTFGQTFLTRLNIKGILKILPEPFIRVHRSYIVSFQKVNSFQNSSVFIGQKKIPIGDSFRANLIGKINSK